MGTNYYLIIDDNACPECGRGEERKHIGKSSAGWCFQLRIYRQENIFGLNDWLPLFEKYEIRDGHGIEVPPDAMLATICARAGTGNRQYASWYTQNNAHHGPFGLARCPIDGKRCVGHGESTYDLMDCDFS